MQNVCKYSPFSFNCFIIFKKFFIVGEFVLSRLHRSQKHVLDFLLSELGTSGSIDGCSQLIIKGRFQQKQIENVLRRYIKVGKI